MKQRLPAPQPGRPWQHLQPVLDAEADWGNTSRSDTDRRVRICSLDLSRRLGPPRKERTGLLRRLFGP